MVSRESEASADRLGELEISEMEIVERAPRTIFYRLIAWRMLQFGTIAAFSICVWECFSGIANINKITNYSPKMAAFSNVHYLLTEQAAAWNKGDLDGFMLGYWKSDELTFYSDNTIEKGYEPLKQHLIL